MKNLFLLLLFVANLSYSQVLYDWTANVNPGWTSSSVTGKTQKARVDTLDTQISNFPAQIATAVEAAKANIAVIKMLVKIIIFMETKDLIQDTIYFFSFGPGKHQDYIGKVIQTGRTGIKHYLNHDSKLYSGISLGNIGSAIKTCRLATAEEIAQLETCIKACEYIEPYNKSEDYDIY